MSDLFNDAETYVLRILASTNYNISEFKSSVKYISGLSDSDKRKQIIFRGVRNSQKIMYEKLADDENLQNYYYRKNNTLGYRYLKGKPHIERLATAFQLYSDDFLTEIYKKKLESQNSPFKAPLESGIDAKIVRSLSHSLMTPEDFFKVSNSLVSRFDPQELDTEIKNQEFIFSQYSKIKDSFDKDESERTKIMDRAEPTFNSLKEDNNKDNDSLSIHLNFDSKTNYFDFLKGFADKNFLTKEADKTKIDLGIERD